MLLNKLTQLMNSKKNKGAPSRYKKQSDPFDAKPEGIDFIAPSMIRETLPGEISPEGVKKNDYAVEIGGTIAPARFFRSFFAEIAAGNTWAGMLDSLLNTNLAEGDIDLAIHVRPAANDRELESIARRIAGLLSDRATENNPSKVDEINEEIDDLRKRQRRIRRSVERSFRVSIQAIVSANEWKPLRMYCNTLVKKFAGRSIILRAADGRQLDALQAVIPLTKSNIMKEHFLTMETSNLADLFPYGGGGLSHRNGIIIGKDTLKRPTWLQNFHPSFPNAHMAVIGRSGAGKTFAVMLMINRNVHIGRRGGILDWKGEWEDFMICMNFPFIELSQFSKDRINPYDVDITELPNGDRYVDIEEAANAVQALAFKMIRIYDANALTGEVKVFIGNAIRKQYDDLNITTDVDSLYVQAADSNQPGRFRIGRKMREMPELNGLVKKMLDSDSEAVKTASELIKPFTKLGNSPSYAIFDGQSTVEIKDVPLYAIALNKLDAEIMRPIGLIVAERWMTEKWAKKNTHIEKFMVIEEAQNIFNDLDYGAVWAERAFREGRSTTTSVVPVTQGLEVFGQSKAGIAAIKNCTVKVIGIQEQYDIDVVKDKLNLTEFESDFLVNYATRGLLLVKADKESAIVKFEGTHFEKMMFANEPTDPLYQERKEYMKTLLAAREMKIREDQRAAATV